MWILWLESQEVTPLSLTCYSITHISKPKKRGKRKESEIKILFPGWLDFAACLHVFVSFVGFFPMAGFFSSLLSHKIEESNKSFTHSNLWLNVLHNFMGITVPPKNYEPMGPRLSILTLWILYSGWGGCVTTMQQSITNVHCPYAEYGIPMVFD